MGFLSRILRAPSQSTVPASQLRSHTSTSPTTTMDTSRHATRRELLRVVLRDTLNRHGIPGHWLGADVLVSTSRAGVQGMHWRLVVKHWDPRLLAHGIAIQQALVKRVMSFDPLASNWLTGISWQFDLPDESICPPLPNPAIWTSIDPGERATPATAPAARVEQPSAGVIEGPVRIPDPQPAAADGDARADLERLLAVRDADFSRNANGVGGPATAYSQTEPSRLE